jgi:hypothetical protein
MRKALIAYNNDSRTVLHDFFESCADEAKQICYDNNVDFASVCPPDLNEQSVCGSISDCQICFIAGHGDANGIYNETDGPIVSVHTTNYNYIGKGFYSVACSCAQNLYPHLKAIGVKVFVGYSDIVRVKGDLEPFVNSVMAGLKNFLAGDNAKMAKEKMLTTYDEQIASLDVNSWERKFLVHNKEALVFEFENNTCLVDLD